MRIDRTARYMLAGLIVLGGVAIARAQTPTPTQTQTPNTAAESPASSSQTQATPVGNQAGQGQTQTTQAAAGDATQGAKYFEQAGCGWCHAEAGRVAGKGPKLEDSARSDSFIMFRIKHGKEGAMPAFGNTFNDKQITDILAYIRSLKG